MTTRLLTLAALFAAATASGCAALSNPVADGVPVHRVPPEVLVRPKADLVPVPLTALRQRTPDAYRLDAGDILAVTADDVLGPPDRLPPVELGSQSGLPPAVGYPIPVRDDGTISLPRLPPIPVRGLTLSEAEKRIIEYATGMVGGVELVKPTAARVTVQLLRKRTYEVLVFREDAVESVFGGGGGGAFGGSQPVIGSTVRSRGFTLRMEAYENDVLRALTATGGLPGFTSQEEVLILRDCSGPPTPDQLRTATRIPLRAYPERPVSIRPEEIVLRAGDVVFVPARGAEVFYTAGLLGSGQYRLPDYDLDVVQAVALVHGPILNGAFGGNNLAGAIIQPGLGFPSISLVTVLRTLPDGRQYPIEVDLSRAFRDPRERILIAAGDTLVMQERSGDAITRYLTNTFTFTTVADTIESSNVRQTLVGVNP